MPLFSVLVRMSMRVVYASLLSLYSLYNALFSIPLFSSVNCCRNINTGGIWWLLSQGVHSSTMG